MAWKSVSSDKHLYLRGRKFYVRRRVPTEVRHVIGKEFLIKSLDTSDFKEASRLATFANADHQRRLDEAVGRLFPPENSRKLDELSANEVETMVTDWFASTYRAAALAFGGEDLYIPEPDEFEGPDELGYSRHEMTRKLQILSLPDQPSHEQMLSGVIRHLATKNGLAIRRVKRGAMDFKTEIVADKLGWRYRMFFDLIRRGTIELMRQEIAQIAAIPPQIVDPELNEVIQSPSRRGKRTVTLGELIQEFKNDPNRRNMRKKVELDYSLLFRVMDEVIGMDRRLRHVERDDCKAVRDLLMRLPSNSTKLYRHLTFTEAADQGSKDERPVLSGTTVNSYVHKMSALFNYAVAEERIDKNPARKLGLEGYEHDEEDRNPFSIEQLERIFTAPIFVGCVDDGRNWAKVGQCRPKGPKFWVPIIGLFQGMRLNEICQLAVADIKEEDGVTFFDIRPDTKHQRSDKASTADEISGRRTKTPSSRRKVPVHPRLTELGFVNFVDAQRKSGAQRLFPELKRDSRGYYSDGFQKWFSRLLQKQGAKYHRTSFHSFRHNWADEMRLAGVTQERRRLIGGWKRTATDERYGSELPLTELFNEVAKLKYCGITAINSL